MIKKTVTIDSAIEIIRQNTFAISFTENVFIDNALGRICAADYFSDIDIPPFNKSAMDGYVVSKINSTEYKIKGTIKAGQKLNDELKDDECFAIMTGAPLNSNGKKVIKIEDTQLLNGKIKVVRNSSNDNVCYQGEDVKKGAKVISKNGMLSFFSIGSLAAIGVNEVEVLKKIKLCVAITGDELLPIENEPANGMIRDINSHTLKCRIKNIPFCECEYYGIIPDNLESTKKTIENFIESGNNILLLSGGSSAGEFDFVTKALCELECKILINGIKIQPGKPTIFAKHNEKLIFGLPGNPVSVLTAFEMFVKECIYKMSGIDYRPVIFNAILNENYSRKKTERTALIPVEINLSDKKIFAKVVRYNGSAHITAFNNIEYLGIINANVEKISKGEEILVRQIWQNY